MIVRKTSFVEIVIQIAGRLVVVFNAVETRPTWKIIEKNHQYFLILLIIYFRW